MVSTPVPPPWPQSAFSLWDSLRLDTPGLGMVTEGLSPALCPRGPSAFVHLRFSHPACQDPQQRLWARRACPCEPLGFGVRRVPSSGQPALELCSGGVRGQVAPSSLGESGVHFQLW